MLSVLLCLGMKAQADNKVTLSAVDGKPGDEITVSIALSNTDVVSSLQLSIPFDEKTLTLVDGSGAPGSRCPNHLVTVGTKDGAINVFVYSMTMKNFSGNSGVVATFKVKLGVYPGTYSLEPATTTLTSAEGGQVSVTSGSTTVTVNGARIGYSPEEMDFGRVPIGEEAYKDLNVENQGNADLVITGIVFSNVNTFSSPTTFPITLHPGESKSISVCCAAKSRDVLNQTLTLICNSPNTKNTIRLKAEPYVVNELIVGSAKGASDEEVTIQLTMKNNDAVSGYQVEFEMPKSLLFVEGSFQLSDRKQDHTSAVSFDGTTLRIIVYSPGDKPFTGNDGAIGSFKVKLNGRESTDLTPTNVVLSATIDNVVTNVVSNYCGGWISIVCPYIVGDDELNFWDVPVTDDCIREYAVSNTGEVPLVISRVVFDDENFSIDAFINSNGEWKDPVFPLEIATGNTWYLRVKYGSLEEVPFEGVMQIHSNDPEMRLKEVKLKGRRFAPNFLNFETHNVSTTGMLNIQVTIDNYDAINGVQFDLEYPEGYQPFENNYTLGTKAAGMEMSVTQISDRTLRYIFYSLSDNSIARGYGTLMNIRFKPIGGSISPGEYQFYTRNLTLGTEDMENQLWTWGCENCNYAYLFYVKDVLRGDANSDSSVTITDAVAIVNSILGNSYGAFEYAAADVNGDGEITISDAVGVVNIILNQGASAPAME